MASKRPFYVASIDRVGIAIAVGGALGGLGVVALVIAGGQRAMAVVLIAWLIGALVSIIAIVTLGGPAWLALHRANRRGPVAAAITGGAIAFVIATAAQQLPVVRLDPYALASTLTLSAVAAVAAAAIGLIIQRIAYSRLM